MAKAKKKAAKKTKRAAPKKKAAKKKAAPAKKQGVVAQVWAIADSMSKASRREVIDACIAKDINIHTAQTQYSKWCKAHGVKRAPRQGRTVPKMSDKGVRTISSTKYKDGWQSKMITIKGRTEILFICPEGVSYIKAQDNERADLIVKISGRGLPPVYRLRRYETSSKFKQVVKEAKKTKARKAGRKANNRAKKAAVKRGHQ